MSIQADPKEALYQAIFDLKVEAHIANLIESGIENPFYLHPKGIFNRNFRKDILDQRIEIDDEGDIFGIHLDISREGLFDMLPEGLFHRTEIRDPFKRVNDMVDEYKRHQKEEADARKFFSPLEQAFYRLRLLVEIKEREALKGFSDVSQQKVIREKLGVFQEALTPVQLMILLYLLPISYRIVGDFETTSKCFEAILGEQVQIFYAQPEKNQGEKTNEIGLGETSLGVNFVVGSTFFDFIPSIEIVIGPIPSKKVVDYLENGASDKIVSMLCDYFIPVELKVNTKIEIEQEDQLFDLSEEKNLSRLGFTSTI